jgi:hypothetical protein
MRSPTPVLEVVQRRLDEDPQAMRWRRETVEHPFGTIKARMGATHFLMKTLPRVAAEMALHALAYNLTRVINWSCFSLVERHCFSRLPAFRNTFHYVNGEAYIQLQGKSLRPLPSINRIYLKRLPSGLSLPRPRS